MASPELIDRKGYLIRKMVDGAKALGDFFDGMVDGTSPTAPLAEELGKRYHLRPSQQRYLCQIAERAEEIRVYIRELEDEFGIERKGDEKVFTKPSRLHEHLFGERKYKGRVISYGLGIGFYPEKWEDSKKVGFTSFVDIGGNGQSKTVPFFFSAPEEVIRGIVSDDLRAVYKEAKKKKTAEWMERLINGVSNMVAQGTIQHEMRHIFNYVMGGDVEETPSCLFLYRSPRSKPQHTILESYGSVEQAVAKDMAKRQARFEREQERLKAQKEELEEAGAPANAMEEIERRIRYIEGEKREDIQRMTVSRRLLKQFLWADMNGSLGIDGRVLSYLYSSLPPEKRAPRLQAVKDYCRENVHPPRMLTDKMIDFLSKLHLKTDEELLEHVQWRDDFD